MKMPKPDRAAISTRNELIKALSGIVAKEGVIWSEEELKAYECDGLTAYRQVPLLAVLPETSSEVSKVLSILRKEGR